MRNIIAAVVCLVLVAGVASANDIHLYFSTQGDNSMVPPEFTAGVNPGPVAMGDPIYLWANIDPSGDIWNGLSLDLTVGNATVPSPAFNPDSGIPNMLRWNPGSDLDFGGDNHMFGVAVMEWGLGSAAEPLMAPGYNVGNHWLVAEIIYDAAVGNEFLAVGAEGIARQGGDPLVDAVYFGFDLGGMPDGPIPGNAFGQTSVYPDIIPEPASLLLLGLAGLALRRR